MSFGCHGLECGHGRSKWVGIVGIQGYMRFSRGGAEEGISRRATEKKLHHIEHKAHKESLRTIAREMRDSFVISCVLCV
jgi:hypothetical protein